MDDARAKISAWRTRHNESRPHSAPDWATPPNSPADARARQSQVTARWASRAGRRPRRSSTARWRCSGN
ncbi:integrase core domain-containing protein [Cupriavidus sp. IK-TO18]|uniref:integrase core domain-containing protein n=1 Tax=unclassified Cupriavidus TaxID=2640874 RepID=UPI001054FBC4|nr:transposase [Cupriavidus sp. IK-TO18]TDF61199.1 hypothetical protein E1J61_32990 [Cupriavidus sp. L7L]